MTDFLEIQRLQGETVREIAASVTDLMEGDWGDREWARIAANVEIDTAQGRRISAQTSAIARSPGHAFEDVDFRLSRQAKDALVALREAMRDQRGAWNTCDVTIDRSGKYHFDFSYEPPRRLNGDLLHSPLTGHLDRYLSETSGR